MSAEGSLVESFSANGQLIFGYFGSTEYPNELWVYGDFTGLSVTTTIDFGDRTSLEARAMWQSNENGLQAEGNVPAASGTLHLTNVTSGDHLLTVCQDGACDTIPVRIPGIPLQHVAR
jgi:hypothetical protein